MKPLHLMAGLAGLAMLAACGSPAEPMPLADAQALCARVALKQQSAPPVNLGVGIGTGHWSRNVYGNIGISTNVAGRRSSPEQVYASCVQQRAGRPAGNSLADQLGVR